MTSDTRSNDHLGSDAPSGTRRVPVSETPTGPLAGIRVLDLTSVVMGPLATQILGDLGAEIITLERSTGDTNRVMGNGPHPQLSGVALNLQRNKRNVSINIKSDAGYELLTKLLSSIDVVITNFRPAVLTRARLSYEEVSAIRPDVVFCQAHGFSSDSGRADEPAYDDIIQAASGFSDAALRTTGAPALAPTIFADKVCALSIVYAVSAALFRRERTGEGEHIELPMVDVMRSFMLVEHGASRMAPIDDSVPAGYARLLTPERRPHQTTDGWISILPYSAEHYETLFRESRPDLLGDERYADAKRRIANSDFLYRQVRSIMATRSTREWLDFCREHSIPATAVTTLEELVDDLPIADHPIAGSYRHIPSPVRFHSAPASLHRPAPLIGQDTVTVLRELGLDDDAIRDLAETGAVDIPEAAGSDAILPS